MASAADAVPAADDSPELPADLGAAAADLAGAVVPVAAVVRSGVVESVHHGAAAVVVGGSRDRPVASAAGRADLAVLPRSVLKPLHAVALLELGLDVPDDELAVVCASHSGTSDHVAVVRRLLARAGLDETALRNTAGAALDAGTAATERAAGRPVSRLHQNCSGDHAGMLAGAVAAGLPTDGYLDPDHPVQQAIAAVVSRLAGPQVGPPAVDGCGAPAFRVALDGVARAYAALAAAPAGTPEHRVARAMRSHPWLLGGPGRDVTALAEAVPGLVVKDGADGVMAAGLPGFGGVAVKIADGHDRARAVVLQAGLSRLGVAGGAAAAHVPVMGGGREVGQVVALPWSVAPPWPAAG